MTPWQAFEAACDAATGEALAALHREREARWRAITAGLPMRDGIRALMAAGEVSQAHGAMMLRAVAER